MNAHAHRPRLRRWLAPALALAALAAGGHAPAAEQLVVNRCADEPAIWLAAIERGGACAGCLTQVRPTASRARYLVRVAAGAQARMRVPEGEGVRLYTYPVGRFRSGAESDGQSPLELVSLGGRCVVRTVHAAMATR